MVEQYQVQLEYQQNQQKFHPEKAAFARTRESLILGIKARAPVLMRGPDTTPSQQ
jgi:hypothetical protein